MVCKSGELFRRHFKAGLGRERKGENSLTPWTPETFKKEYERVRQDLVEKGAEELSGFPKDPDTLRRWLLGESVVQQRYRRIVLAVFFGSHIDESHSNTDLARAWDAEPGTAKAIPTVNLSNVLLLDGGGFKAYPTWHRFDEFLSTVERGSEIEQEDLRIVTTGFTNNGVPADQIGALLERNVRIRILLTDPQAGATVLRARNQIREDSHTPQMAAKAIKSQISQLDTMIDSFERLKTKNGGEGSLEYRLSSLMPYGFVAHTRRFVILGLLLATHSYGRGPMLVFDAESNREFWSRLKAEWVARWEYQNKMSGPKERDQELAEFFGSKDELNSGRIILQADSLGGLMKNWINGGEEEKIEGSNRVFKARRWINACDTQGAQAIVEEFRKHRRNPPKLFVSERAIPDADDCPFEIVMGGLTDMMKRNINKIGRGWLRHNVYDDSGDTISLHEKIPLPINCFKEWPPEDGFVRLLPLEWGKDYVSRWRKNLVAPNEDVVDDYAMILRHTHDGVTGVKLYLSVYRGRDKGSWVLFGD